MEEYKKLLSNQIDRAAPELYGRVGNKNSSRRWRESEERRSKIAEWEQHNIPIICERPGYVKYEDLVEGISTQREVNKQTGQTELIVKQHRGELHPQIVIYADQECTELVGTYAIPSGAVISVQEGQYVSAGMILAQICLAVRSRRRISPAVLPRVAELFEARRPKDAAEIAKIDGVVDFRGVQKNKRIVVVRDEDHRHGRRAPHSSDKALDRPERRSRRQRTAAHRRSCCSSRDPRDLRRSRTPKVPGQPSPRSVPPPGGRHQR